MKTIDFSLREILPDLLNGKKIQTIRKAWIADKIKGIKGFRPNYCDEKARKPMPHPVGSERQIMWKKRSKSQWFCVRCGNGARVEKRGGVSDYYCDKCGLKPFNIKIFKKRLKKVFITEVFLVYINKTNGKFYLKDIRDGEEYEFNPGVIQVHPELLELAEKDGFRIVAQMFLKLDQLYDLKDRKPLWVTRWRKI